METGVITNSPLALQAARYALAVWGWPEGRDLAPELHGPLPDAQTARTLLEASHRDEVHPNWQLIHKSWLLRALDAGSPTIRRLVSELGPPQVQFLLQNDDGSSLEGLRRIGAPHPEIARCVLDLWCERLVAGPPPNSDDGPVIHSLADRDRARQARRLFLVGLFKQADLLRLTSRHIDPRHMARLKLADLALFMDRYQDVEVLDPMLMETALSNLAACKDWSTPELIRFGMSSHACLLGFEDRHRARWVIQSLPYPLAKNLRVGMEEVSCWSAPLREATRRWENDLLQTAQQQVDREFSVAANPQAPPLSQPGKA